MKHPLTRTLLPLAFIYLSFAILLMIVMSWLSPFLYAEECPVYPVPKEFRNLNDTWLLAPDAAIVIGLRATEQERYAAEQLQTHFKRRYKKELPVLSEKESVRRSQIFLLGTVTSNDLLASIVSEKKIKLTEQTPGMNGFVLDFLRQGNQQIILIGGSDVCGVIYGQGALTDLLSCPAAGDSSAKPGTVYMTAVSLRDWPDIPWRGRPHLVLRQQLVPGVLDAYAHLRLNYTDVRDNPDFKVRNTYPDRAAPMGFPPGVPLDTTNVKKMIDESHRRGMFVYGCVASATAQKAGGIIEGFDKKVNNLEKKVLGTFQELVDLGVDGLWISFDDIGGGANPSDMIQAVLAFGRKQGMTGRKIAYTPPLGDYQVIDRPYNREAAKLSEFNEAQWYFTRVPCEADRDMAKKIGLKLRPAWWHNLVGLSGGFLHNANIAVSLREGDLPSYVELQSLKAGWGRPDDETLRNAAQWTDNVMIWGICGGWPEEYLAGALGHWAWAPKTHDWSKTQKAIYSWVYGPDLWEKAKEFDEKLVALKLLYYMPVRQFEPNKGWPCRLRRPQDREKVLACLDQLDALAKALQAAHRLSALAPERLEKIYLEPMRATLDYARRMTLLDYPDDTFPEAELEIIDLLDSRDEKKKQEAKLKLTDLKTKTEKQLINIEKSLTGLKGIDGYVKYWHQKMNDLNSIQKYSARRLETMAPLWKKTLTAPLSDVFPIKVEGRNQTFEGIVKNVKELPGLPDHLRKHKLLQFNAGDWKEEYWRWRGTFNIGRTTLDGKEYIGIGFPRHVPSRTGDYGAVGLTFPVPDFKNRLKATLFLTDTRLDNQYRGYRYVEVLANNKMVWSDEIVADQTGKEWVTVDLTAIVQKKKELDLKVRVIDRNGVGGFPSILLLGPVFITDEK